MMRAPWSTAKTIAAASSTSREGAVAPPACTTISRASAATPAIPSPFEPEPAASAATKVPWPLQVGDVGVRATRTL